MHRYAKRLLFLPALALGVLVLVLAARSRSGPTHQEVAEAAQSVSVVTVSDLAVTPRAVGYGYIEPGQVWQGVAEVAGTIVELNPELDKGAIILRGELLLRIDPAKKTLAQERSRADVQDILAQLEELDRREAATRRQLELEEANLAIARTELARQKKLVEQAIIAQSEYDQVNQNVISQQNAAEGYRSQLERMPAERAALQAKLTAAKASLREAGIDLEKTEIRAPFDLRVREVNVEKTQAVSVGQTLVQADSMGVAEVLAQVPLSEMRRIIPQGTAKPEFTSGFSLREVLRSMGLTALVSVSLGRDKVHWSGRVSRLAEEVDPQTRTMGVYVAVDEPYLQVKPGVRPPLIRNMFCTVTLAGPPLPPAPVVPRAALSAIDGDRAFVNVVSNADGSPRLTRREVGLGLVQGSLALVTSGLTAGETVVSGDLIPAIEGMLLDPVRDTELEERLKAEATRVLSQTDEVESAPVSGTSSAAGKTAAADARS